MRTRGWWAAPAAPDEHPFAKVHGEGMLVRYVPPDIRADIGHHSLDFFFGGDVQRQEPDAIINCRCWLASRQVRSVDGGAFAQEAGDDCLPDATAPAGNKGSLAQ
jgi:hypothetical protein